MPAPKVKKAEITTDDDLDSAIKSMKKDYGDQSIREKIEVAEVERLPFDIFALDYATGGGLPRGRVTEIFGNEGSGKTNSVLKAMRSAQALQPHLRPAFIDLEGSLTPDWARKMGVNPDRVVYLKPDFAEQAVDMLSKITQARGLSMVALDSIAAMASTAEVAKGAEGDLPGVNARIGSKLCRQMIYALNQVEKAILSGSRHDPMPAVVFINQVRNKIGVLYGSPETTPGGKALPFLYGMRLQIYGKGVIDNKINDAMPIYKETTVTLKKFKVPVLAMTAEYNLVMHPHKMFKVGDVLDWTTLEAMMKEAGLLTKGEKANSGYEMCGEHYDKLRDCVDRYYADLSFRVTLHKAFIEQAMDGLVDVLVDSAEVLGDAENAPA